MANKPEIQFAQKMIPHHAKAIAMSEKVIAQGSDAEIRKLARKMLKAQTQEIAFLEAWLRENGQPKKPSGA